MGRKQRISSGQAPGDAQMEREIAARERESAIVTRLYRSRPELIDDYENQALVLLGRGEVEEEIREIRTAHDFKLRLPSNATLYQKLRREPWVQIASPNTVMPAVNVPANDPILRDGLMYVLQNSLQAWVSSYHGFVVANRTAHLPPNIKT